MLSDGGLACEQADLKLSTSLHTLLRAAETFGGLCSGFSRMSGPSLDLKFSDEVSTALAKQAPIVALESTIISHGTHARCDDLQGRALLPFSLGHAA